MSRWPGWHAFSGIFARLRSYWRGVHRRSDIEADMREEFRHHIEMRTEDLVRGGVPRGEAARRAHREFGHVESHREAARASRGLRWIDQIRFSWIDVKLGLRMMVKHPGLTLVAVFALALGIPVGLTPAHLSRVVDAPLPEDVHNRVRAIRYWDPASGTVVLPTYWELDFLSERMMSFDRLGAYRSSTYNVASEDGRAAPVQGTEVTASIFGMLRTAPLMGRTLDVGDESAGSAEVVVIGQDLWEARFGSDPGIVGRTIHVGSHPYTVVGVMPEGFRFPVNDQIWMPIRPESVSRPGAGRPLRVLGRLADGATDGEAQAELTAVSLPPRHEAARGRTPLQLEVVPFAYSYMGLPRGGMESLPEFPFFQLLAFVLLLVACANVAMLVFARTATRFRELAVRSALGASRWRIVSQIFVETLLMAGVATAAGLLVIDRVVSLLPWAAIAGEAMLPYWLDLGVTAEALPSAALLAVISATVAGVVPALRITTKDVQGSLRTVEAGRSGIRFGGGTSVLVVGDVAIAVAVVGFAVGIARYMMDTAHAEGLVGIPAKEYLAFELRLSANEMQGEPGGADVVPTERLAALQQTLSDRLGAEPQVRTVVFADALPRMNHRSRLVRVDGDEHPDDSPGRWVRVARVDIDFFDALGHPILAGRDFDWADTEAGPTPVIVNTVFVQEMLGGADPVGRRIRLAGAAADPDTPWHEIVGVVGRLGMNIVSRTGDPGVYFPSPPGGIHPVQVGIRVGPTPERFVPRLREILAEVDPSAILGTPVVLDRVYQGDWYLSMGVAGGLGLLVGILIALAASGIYAMMSFSVSERTREIGIRTALGAGRPELVVTILRRALMQLGAGAALGIPLATWLLLQIRDPKADASATGGSVMMAIALALMIVSLVGVLSCAAPARRAIGIEANDALRAEG